MTRLISEKIVKKDEPTRGPHTVPNPPAMAQKVIRELFGLYMDFPNALPDAFYRIIQTEGIKRTISDYIAGMTDRFALEEHQRLTDPMIRV